MAEFALKPYLPETNKLYQVYMGTDGWLYNDLRFIETTHFGGESTKTQVSVAHFTPYFYKNVVYLKFNSWGNQGFEDHYLSVSRDGQLGLYNWMGATGWKLDFEEHLVSVYNGQNVALAGNIYKATNSYPGLRFRKGDNPDLWEALNHFISVANTLTPERTPTYGGTGGTLFGGALPTDAIRITSMRVGVGTQINAIVVSYADWRGGIVGTLKYGPADTNPGTWNEIALGSEEYITEVQGRADTVVRQLTFKTNKGRTFGPYGPAQGNDFSVTGKLVIGFFGKAGTAIDQIGFMRLNSLPTVRTEAFGGPGGNVFECAPPPGAVRVSRVTVYAGNQVNAIGVDWWNDGGGFVGSGSFGSGQYAGTSSGFFMPVGQYITEVSGMADTVVRQISFKLNNGQTYGPYGTAAGTPFTVKCKEVVGFFGRASAGVDQLGVVATPPPAPRASAGLEFNGTDTHVILDAPLPVEAQVTLEMWARGVPKESLLFWLTDDDRRRQLSAHLPYIDGYVYFDAAADVNNNYDRILKSAAPHDPNAWNHWAFVRNSATGRMAIYKNGDLFLEVTGAIRTMTTCNRFVLGGDGEGNWRHAGAIAEVRLWNVERTAAQIKDNMTRVLQGPDTGLVLTWSLDGIQADGVVIDGSGSGRHGKLMGALKATTPPTALAT